MSLTTVKAYFTKSLSNSNAGTLTVEVLNDLSNIVQSKNIELPKQKSDLLNLSAELWKADNKPSIWSHPTETTPEAVLLSNIEAKKWFQKEIVDYTLKNYTSTDEESIEAQYRIALYVPESAKEEIFSQSAAALAETKTSLDDSQNALVSEYENNKTTIEEALNTTTSEAASLDGTISHGDINSDPPNAAALIERILEEGKASTAGQRPTRDIGARNQYQKNLAQFGTMNLKRFGLMGEELNEPVPEVLSYVGDWHREGKNNSGIIAGRDEHYRLRGHTKSGAIYMYAGRSPHNIVTEINDGILESGWSNTNLKKPNNLIQDAAYLYLSQKSDPSPLLRVAEGTYGKRKGVKYPRLGLSLAALKADDVVIMARETGIRLITGTDRKNSKGGDILGKFGIDLIAGNDDSDLQPLVKGDNLLLYLKGLSKAVDELHAITYNFLTSQIEFNGTVAKHRHYDPFCLFLGTIGIGDPKSVLEGQNLQSDTCMQAGIKSMLEGVQQQFNAAKGSLNRINNDFNALNDIGKYKILSERNRTN